MLIGFNSQSLMTSLGQDPEISRITQQYVVGILPGLFMNFLFDLYRNYLNSQNIFMPPSAIFCCALVLHIIMTSILSSAYGFTGIIISTNITNLVAVALIYLYMYRHQILPAHSVKNLMCNMKQYVLIVLPIALPMQVDVFCFEINSLLIGYQKNVSQFGAHVAISNFIGFLYSFPSGLAGALCYLISNSFGQKTYHKSRNYAIVGTINAALYSLIALAGMITLRNTIC